MFQDGQIAYFIKVEHMGGKEIPYLYYGRIVETNFVSEYGEAPKVFYSFNVETRYIGTTFYENIPEEFVFLDKKAAEEARNEFKI